MQNVRDLTTGSIGKKMLAFAAPIMVMNLLQTVYNVVDMIIVGHFVGTAGMSAVSIGGQVTNLVLLICNGLANGGSVLVSQHFGARQPEKAKRIVGTSMSFLTLAALLLTAVAIVLRFPILRALNTPQECFDDTLSYLIICMAGTVFVYLTEALNAAIRGMGNSLFPMIFVAITTVENVILDLLLVGVFGMGAAGAALATITCQCTNMALVIYCGKKILNVIDFTRDFFKIRLEELKVILKVGLPQCIQFVSTSVSFLLISSLVNTFGVAAAAAAGAASKLNAFALIPGRAAMTAETTVTAQNHPRKNFSRIIKGMLIGEAVAVGFSCIFFAFCVAFPTQVYGIFTPDPAVPLAGNGYLRFFAIGFIVESILFPIIGIPTGSGYTVIPMASSIISAFVIRYAFAWALCRFTALGFDGIGLAYSLAPIVGITLNGYFVLSGKWKKSPIKLNQ